MFAGAIHARGYAPVCSILVSVVCVCLLVACGHVYCLLWSTFVFSHVYAGIFPSPLFWDCGLLPSFIVRLWLLMYPGFGLLLSCFGHARAKNNYELPCGLELCFIFCLGLSPVVFAFITEP